ncbi:MAG: MerR family transcriptional regulator [Nitrospirota bacterium]
MKQVSFNPNKLFYKISEVSKMTGLEAYVLRYWETEFPILRPKKSRGGQRVYERKDIELVLQIKKLLYEDGMTIAGARKILTKRGAKAERNWPLFLGQLKHQLEEIVKLTQSAESKDKGRHGKGQLE